jgi:hypothetical protein
MQSFPESASRARVGARRALLSFVLLSSGLAGCGLEDAPPAPSSPPVSSGRPTFPVSPGLSVSPEMGLDAPVSGLPAAQQLLAGVAFDGAQHLVVWEDHRAPIPAIYAARVDAGGGVLDPVGVRVADGQNPSVAAGAGEFLVTFQVRGGFTGAQGAEIRAARVSAAGAVLDPGGFALGAGDGSWDRPPSVAFDGASFVVVWSGEQAGGEELLRGRVSAAGAVLDPGGELTASDAGAGRGAVAFDGTATLVAWLSSDLALHGARISPTGTLLSGFLIEGPPSPQIVERAPPVVTFDGAHDVVAWTERRGSDDTSWIRARRITTEGAPLDPASLVVASEQEPWLRLDRLAAAFNGASTVFTWGRSYEESAGSALELARLSPEGSALDPVPALLAEGGTLPALAPHSAGALAVWTDILDEHDFYEGTSIVGARLDMQGEAVDTPPLAISTSANAQTDPTLAFDGENFFVAWTDDRHYQAGDRMDVLGARVSPEGTLLDPSGITLASGLPSQRRPLALFDGQRTVVVWSDQTGGCCEDGSPNPGVRGVRSSPEGAVIDAAPITLVDHDYSFSSRPILAGSAGGTTLLAMRTFDSIEALQLSQAGVVTGPLPLGASPIGAVPHAFASDGVDHLVLLAGDVGPVLGEWVSSSGDLLAPGVFEVTADPVLLRSAAATCGGGICLVVWDGDEAGNPIVRAARVTRAGDVLDPQGIALSGSAHLAGCGGDLPALGHAVPAVAFDGQTFVVAWREPSIPCDASSIDLRGAEVGLDGVAGATFTLSEEPGIEGPPALASTGAGETLVAYARLLVEAPYGAQRVRLRRITAGAGEAP